jgi:hypothetical protein
MLLNLLHLPYSYRQFERTISLRFLGIILRVLRLEVFVYNVSITNQFQINFAWGGGGGERLVEVTVNSKEENRKILSNYVPEFCLCSMRDGGQNLNLLG